MNEILDLDTLMAVKKASPKVTGVSYGHTKAVFETILKITREPRPGMDDGNGQTYWESTVKEICVKSGVEIKLIGRACREMGLTMWRRGEGYHVAWSSQQLSILISFFKIT